MCAYFCKLWRGQDNALDIVSYKRHIIIYIGFNYYEEAQKEINHTGKGVVTSVNSLVKCTIILHYIQLFYGEPDYQYQRIQEVQILISVCSFITFLCER